MPTTANERPVPRFRSLIRLMPASFAPHIVEEFAIAVAVGGALMLIVIWAGLFRFAR